MAGIKEIRDKIQSIKSTQKITRVMEMVAASKMRKAQDRMKASKPYTQRIRDMIAHLLKGCMECEHTYLIERKVKRAGYIVIATDRGLCGGLNVLMFKRLLSEMEVCQNRKVKIDVCTFGKKAEVFFKRLNSDVVASISNLGDRPLAAAVIGPVKVMLDAYEQKKIDKIFLVYNEFKNTMTQIPRIDLLLPVINLQPSDEDEHCEYINESIPGELLNSLLKKYIESLVYQGVVENVACEQAARMVAMKSATDNAGELIDEFQLMYNKARQATITKELSEIVAGAEAV